MALPTDTITLDGNGNASQVFASGTGQHVINARVILKSNLFITTDVGAHISFAQGIDVSDPGDRMISVGGESHVHLGLVDSSTSSSSQGAAALGTLLVQGNAQVTADRIRLRTLSIGETGGNATLKIGPSQPTFDGNGRPSGDDNMVSVITYHAGDATDLIAHDTAGTYFGTLDG